MTAADVSSSAADSAQGPRTPAVRGRTPPPLHFPARPAGFWGFPPPLRASPLPFLPVRGPLATSTGCSPYRATRSRGVAAPIGAPPAGGQSRGRTQLGVLSLPLPPFSSPSTSDRNLFFFFFFFFSLPRHSRALFSSAAAAAKLLLLLLLLLLLPLGAPDKVNAYQLLLL